MEIDASRLKELVERPAESLSVEIKTWIDPNEPEGCAKIVLAALALRNYGGGYLLIGFDNKSLQPDKSNAPANPKGDVSHRQNPRPCVEIRLGVF